MPSNAVGPIAVAIAVLAGSGLILRLGKGRPITIDGLWAIAFGNGSAAGPTDTL